SVCPPRGGLDSTDRPRGGAVFRAANIDAIRAVRVPELGFDREMVLADPAITRPVVPIITAVCGDGPTDPAPTRVHCPGRHRLGEVLRHRTQQVLDGGEVVLLALPQQRMRPGEDDLITGSLDLPLSAQIRHHVEYKKLLSVDVLGEVIHGGSPLVVQLSYPH